MDYRGNDPGAVQHGNFINYYQFNSAEDRIKLLPDNIWNTDAETSDPYIVLDVGCNTGAVTRLLQNFLTDHTKRKVLILGVDIDPVLIERANESNDLDEISYECADMMENTLPCSIVKFLSRHNRDFFDAVFCLSITMWIHINNGDEGLRCFLQKCSTLASMLILEPQPWKCYQTAVKRLRKAGDAFRYFADLKWRSNIEEDIQTYLVENLGCALVHRATPTRWNRKICIYRTPNKN